MARRRADRSVNAELALGRGATGRYDGVSSATLPVVEGDAALAETGLAKLPPVNVDSGSTRSIPRTTLIGYFEGLDAERAIAWRSADPFALRECLGLVLPEAPPDPSTISRTFT